MVLVVIFIGGCCTAGKVGTKEDTKVNALKIEWQRFVSKSGGTCSRCELTQKEVKDAFRSLEESLAPLGIRVTLDEKTLDSAACAKDISQSNRIWIDEHLLEEWLGAEVGKSPCGVCCAELGADVECRTIEVDGQIYEKIPAELIVKAGLVAASERVVSGENKPCCPKKACSKPCVKSASSSCCPKPDASSKEH
jgi:hypothetical protein